MLRRLLAATLVMGGGVGFAAFSAHAQTVNVPFSGTMSANCTFGTPTPGVLVPSGTNALAATPSIGTPGSVSIQCTTPANITVSAPLQTGGSSFTPADCATAIISGGNIVASHQSCEGTSPPAQIDGTNTLDVGMRVDSSSPIPPGDYAYNVTLTIVP